jgi:microcystin-dependent protein
MPTTPDGYYYITDLDQPADMGAHSLADANAAQAVMDAHEAAVDPHPVYATDADLAAHISSPDAHPVYATDADLSAHVAAADPHTGYQRESEKAAASGYASLDASVKVPIAQIPTGSTGSTVALGNHNHDAAYAPLGSNVPAGAIVDWPGSTAPSGWLLCQGQAVSRTTYAALFAVCGTTFGIGDGSSTFNLPNPKGRVVVGLDAAQTEFNTLGKKAGANSHYHEHVYAIGRSSGYVAPHEPGSGKLEWRDSSLRLVDTGISNVGTAETIAAIGYDRYVVKSTSDSSLQPYIALNQIIKT